MKLHQPAFFTLKSLICFIGVFGFVRIGFSQPIEFGKVTKESLKEERYELDLTAHAAVLHKKEVRFYRYQLGIPQPMTLVHERIKFYDLLDLEFASKSIFLGRISFEERESLESFQAQTYNLVGDSIEVSKLDLKTVKRETLKDGTILSFDFPDVKSGSIIEYSYLKSSPIYWHRDDILCQYTIPIKSLDVTVESIKQVKFKQHLVGNYALQVREFERDTIGTKVKAVKKPSDDIYTIYRASHIPAVTDEPFTDNINRHYTAIVFELQKIDVWGHRENVVQDWKTIGQTIAKSRKYRRCLNRDSHYDDALDSLAAGITSPLEKVQAVKEFIQQKVKWNGEVSKIPSPGGCAKSYKYGEGNSADINLLFISMLNYLEIDAYPVLLSTTDSFKPIYPFEGFLNYVVAAVDFNGERHFVDASDREAAIDLMSLRNYGGDGLLLNSDKKNFSMIPLKVETPSKSVVIVNAKMDESGKIEGSLMSKQDNYEARYFKYDYERLGKDDFIEAQEAYYNGIEITDFSTESLADNSQSISQTFDFTAYSHTVDDLAIGELSFYPLSFLRKHENPFLNKFRVSPIYFGYPKIENYNLTISIPEGYEVSELPQSVILKLPDNTGRYKFQIKQLQDKIMISSIFEVDKAYYKVETYRSIRDFFQKMVDKQNELVVLKKTNQ